MLSYHPSLFEYILLLHNSCLLVGSIPSPQVYRYFTNLTCVIPELASILSTPNSGLLESYFPSTLVHPYLGFNFSPTPTYIGFLDISYLLSTVDNSTNLYCPGLKPFVYSPFSSVSTTLYLTPLISSSLPTIFPFES